MLYIYTKNNNLYDNIFDQLYIWVNPNGDFNSRTKRHAPGKSESYLAELDTVSYP